MKRKTKVILSLCGMALTGVAAAVTCYGVLKNKIVILPRNFTVTAHTGCENTADNSLEAIRLGYVSGADIVEFDLHFNSDGLAVLSHDEPTNGVVSLEEAFWTVQQYENLKVNVDIKNTADLKQIVDLSEKYGIRDRIFYTGISQEHVEAVKEQTPDVPYYLNVGVDKSRKTDKEYLLSLTEKVEALGAIGINMHYSGCSKELVSVFHEKGLLVSVWTVNNELDMLRMLHIGPDNITTRKPSLIKSLAINKADK